MEFKGPKPAAQPRSLRSIAENKGTVPADFGSEIAYDHTHGIPLIDSIDVIAPYDDVAADNYPIANGPVTGGPVPFSNLKRGR